MRLVEPAYPQLEMLSLRRLLDNLSGPITLATIYPPDEYPEYSSLTYESHKADIQELWGKVRHRLKRDLDKLDAIDRQLAAMFTAFEMDNKRLGRKIAWDLWNLPIRDLR